MAATWALSQISRNLAPIEVPLAYIESHQYQQRAQAASTLGELGDPAAYAALASLLEDRNPMVQIAAAGAILRLDRSSGQVAGNRADY